MRISELLNEAHPRQQISRYNPDGETYRGQKMPTFSHDDIMMNPEHGGERLDRVQHHHMAQNQDEADPFETDFDRESLKRTIANALDHLTQREQMVLKMRFWNDMTLDEIAHHLGVDRSRARQIEARALRKLKHPSRSGQLVKHVTDIDNPAVSSTEDRAKQYKLGYQAALDGQPEPHAQWNPSLAQAAYNWGYRDGKKEFASKPKPTPQPQPSQGRTAVDRAYNQRDQEWQRAAARERGLPERPRGKVTNDTDWGYGKNGRY